LDDIICSLVPKKTKRTKKGKVTESTRKRKINSTSNLTSLLNIPDFMREYGPPRLYWEGGYKGEGILRRVKPVVTQGTHMPWFATAALQRYYNEKSLGSLLLSTNEGVESDDMGKQQKIDSYSDRKVYTYKQGCGQLQLDVMASKPISAAFCRVNGWIYCIVMENKKRIMVRMDMLDELGVFLGNTYYTPIRLSPNVTLPLGEYKDFISVMILPNREAQGTSKGDPIFFCITEDWTERTRLPNGTIEFALPRIDDVTYI
jgi:hypothetical protein